MPQKRLSPLLLLFFGCAFCIDLQAQSVFGKQVQVRYTDLTMIEMLLDLERQSGVAFYYDPAVLPYYRLSIDVGTVTLYECLTKMMSSQNVSFLAKGDEGIMIVRKGKISKEYLEKVIKRVDSGQMELPGFLKPFQVTASVGTETGSKAPAEVRLRFADAQSLEALPGLSTELNPGAKTCASDVEGYCTWTLQPGTYQVKGKMLGYRELELTLYVYSTGSTEVAMEQRLQNLQEVVVQANQLGNKAANNTTGIEALSAREMKELPSFGGEADVIKSLAVLPGVSSAGEGTSGFSVRGGNVDQNLVLQGNLPFLNASHALGFYSVFNPDVVGNITLYKGDIPARYGGRLSSVLDVELKTPDFSAWHGQLSGSTIAARASIEGPIMPNRVAIVMGARRSYSDWLLRSASLPDVRSSSAWFGDAVTKVLWRISDRTSLSLEGIYARDFFRYGSTFGYEWNTRAGGATLKHALSKRLFLEGHYGVSNLENVYFDLVGTGAFRLSGGMDIKKAHLHTKYVASDRSTLLVGVQWNSALSSAQILAPGSTNSAVLGRRVRGQNGTEVAAFAEGDLKITKKINLKPGLRLVQYAQIGAGAAQLYEPGLIDNEHVIDSVVYTAGQRMAEYNSLEPRLALSYQISQNSSVKMSYNRVRQFLHLISNTIGTTPADVWQPSTRYIKPQVGDNFSIGWARNMPERKREINVEAFYKWSENVPTYKDFAQLLLKEHLETELIAGEMQSYGAEFSYRKSAGRLQYQCAYTWSRVWQRAIAPNPIESVNQGQWFRGYLDQPHQVTLFGKYLRNPSNYVTATVTFRTGKPFSAPSSGYGWQQLVIPYYDARNNERIPNYHRLDIGYTFDQSKRALKGLKYIFQLSLYNVYGRDNALSVFFRRNSSGRPSAYQFAPIGTPIPSAQLTFLL
jgi:hypothetical protein